MCTTSLQSGRLPTSQKTAAAIVTPILKKSGLDPNDVKSYRPVSNLTFMSKVVERLVSCQVTEHLHKNGLLPPVQSAYRRGHSTETALLKIVSDITDATDAGKVSLLAMLDMSSAFDTVDFSILLKRLEASYGISGTVLRWMESFGQDRSQAVVFMGLSAADTPLRYGVPQGSVLGPLLFLVYTADIISLATEAGINAHAYADDIQLYTHGIATQEKEMTDRMVDCIVSIEDWMSSNRLRLNTDKTQVMWFGSRQQLTKLTSSYISIAGANIEFDKSAKILGVILDSELSMRPQVNAVTRSCFYQLRQIRAIRRLLTDKATNTLIVSLVSSRLDYCNSIYFSSTDFVFSKLQSVMNAAARLLSGKRRYDHISPVLKDLHWLRAREA